MYERLLITYKSSTYLPAYFTKIINSNKKQLESLLKFNNIENK